MTYEDFKQHLFSKGFEIQMMISGRTLEVACNKNGYYICTFNKTTFTFYEYKWSWFEKKYRKESTFIGEFEDYDYYVIDKLIEKYEKSYNEKIKGEKILKMENKLEKIKEDF